METLRQKQSRFAEGVAIWIQEVYAKKYEITLGEAYRSDEQAEINGLGQGGRAALVLALRGRPQFVPLAEKIENNTGNGIRNSLHQIRLALDFNLFKDGKICDKVEDFKAVGELWEELGIDYRWGGRFGDPGHISIEHNGVK